MRAVFSVTLWIVVVFILFRVLAPDPDCPPGEQYMWQAGRCSPIGDQ